MPLGPIVWLQTEHLDQLEALLIGAGLPAEDCALQGDIFYGIFDRDELIAAGGLEEAAEYALLRSIVVKSHYRGRGLARSICEFLLERARLQGRVAVYLLTETAAEYFQNLGFEQVARAGVPASIAASQQFSSLCPDSASCLLMNLSCDPTTSNGAQ